MSKIIFAGIIAILTPLTTSAQTYTEWVEKSMTYIEQKDFVSAEIALKNALRAEPANPGNPMLLTNLGTIQRTLKKYDEALTSYNSVLAKYPDNITLLQSRANLYCETEQWQNALIDYNHIIAIEPNNYPARESRALLHLQQKDYANALADFEHLTTIKPESIDGWMGKALIAKQQHKWEEAEEIYTTLIYKHRNNPEIYAQRAECYLHLKKLGRTQGDIEKALALNYNNPYIYVLRALLRMKQYDTGAAWEDFQKAHSLGFNVNTIPEYLQLAQKKKHIK